MKMRGLVLEIGDANDYARGKLNGKQLEAHAWQPYRWDVTDVVRPGSNDLEVEVRTAAAGRGGGAPPPVAAPAAQAAGGRGGRAQAAATAAPAPPAGGRGRTVAPPTGLLGPVRLVAR